MTNYEEVRAIRNGMIERQPALIARCDGVADVISAVNFAREHDLLVAIRGGGHNVAGNALCDGGLVIDLSGMRAVRVDPVGRTVRAEGGATWSDVDRETQVFGLATPGGNVSSTGIAGLSLHGGMGHLRRKYGFSVDNILSVDIVTRRRGTVHCQRDRESGPLLGNPRGRQQLRRHHVDGVQVYTRLARSSLSARRPTLPTRCHKSCAPGGTIWRRRRKKSARLACFGASRRWRASRKSCTTSQS